MVEGLLKTAGEELRYRRTPSDDLTANDCHRTAIRHAQLLPNLPPVVFKRDDLRTERDQINNLLDTADKGAPEETPTIASPERTDLYDSDRTVILRQLSNESTVVQNDESDAVDTDQLSMEQLQRRMKAFALTKRMRRVQEQSNAMYGIMAIEKERATQEHFALHETELSESPPGKKEE